MEENRTDSESKIVLPSFTAERVIRGFLADTLNFLRGRRKWPEVDGDLSDWVLRTHGIQAGNPQEDLGTLNFQKMLSSFDSLCAALSGMPQGRDIRRRLDEVGKEENPKVLKARQSNDQKALDVVLSEAIPKMMRVAGLPEEFSKTIGVVSYAGFVKLLRATRVLLVSMALFHEHPLSLIARAFNGDRRATLDLIKVDHMFVNDRCCKETIRKAALQDDADFMGQVERALKYKRRIYRREILHFYLFNLFLFEQLGVSLPPTNELWKRLDPFGSEYKTLQAFEKDIQRRKGDFEEIVKSASPAAKSLARI